MHFSLATKVFLAFAIVIVTFLSVLVFGITQTQESYSEIRIVNQVIVPLSFSLSDIRNDLKAFNIVLSEHDPKVLKNTIQVTRLGPSLPARFDAKIERTLSIFSKANVDNSKLRHIEGELKALKELVNLFTEEAQSFSNYVVDHNDQVEEIDTRRKKLFSLSQTIDEKLRLLRRSLRSITDLALQKTKTQEVASLYSLAIATGIALSIAIFLVWLVGKNLRPLVELSAATKRLADGDYQMVNTENLGSSEVATLGNEFNAMVLSLKERDDEIGAQHRKLLKSQRLATVGRMTAVITHELRNPLSSINLNSEMLMDLVSKSSDSEAVPILNLIISEVDRLREITDNYLGYAKVSKAQMQPTDLQEILQKLIDFHDWEWEEMGVQVRLECQTPLPLKGDKNQLRQAFLNLLKNAVEASSKESKVTVRAHLAGGKIGVEIEDHGVGIPKESMKNLFEPFVTTKSKGTGLGLAVTQQIIEEHGGKIHVHSTSQKTLFTVELPTD